mgnify:CR=1 FL=1
MSQHVLETIPHRSPLFKPLPRLYAKFEKISVICRAPKEAVRRTLPEPLEYVSDIIEVFAYHCPKVVDLAVPGAERPIRARVRCGALSGSKREIWLTVRRPDVLVFERTEENA